MKFFLGTHEPAWLQQTDVPLFVSRIRLQRRKELPRAIGPWALDSGGFSELDKGSWSIGPAEYAAFVRRCRDEIGNLQWAAIQDWMCEPTVIEKTGKSVEEHQLRTCENYLDLRSIAPDLPWVPVLQGWGIGDYDRHFEMYARMGFDLTKLPLVGVGTVCRRQNEVKGAVIMSYLRDAYGLKLHGFGFKITGLGLAHEYMESADSLAWSYDARRAPAASEGCTHHRCNNCIKYALRWRENLLNGLAV